MPMCPVKNLTTVEMHVFHISSIIDHISAYLPGNSDLHNSSRSNVIVLNEI